MLFIGRAKIDEKRHPKTGGGKPLSPVRSCEEVYLRMQGDHAPNIAGVPGGMETGGEQLNVPLND